MAAAELGAGWKATCEGAVRGALDALKPDDPLNLSNLEVVGEYNHSLDTDVNQGGTVGIAIQAITLNLNRSQDRHEVSSGSLHLAATYQRKEPAPALAAPEKPASG
jgi:hypothetical protein